VSNISVQSTHSVNTTGVVQGRTKGNAIPPNISEEKPYLLTVSGQRGMVVLQCSPNWPAKKQ